jgi:hypothetical protein
MAVMMIPHDYSKQMRNLLADGLTLDAALQKLRNVGASLFEAIRATSPAVLTHTVHSSY